MRVLCNILLSILIGYGSVASADWINLTGAETSPNIAEIYVLHDRVRVNLEVFISELDKFRRSGRHAAAAGAAHANLRDRATANPDR
jgi:hypothetical protein